MVFAYKPVWTARNLRPSSDCRFFINMCKIKKNELDVDKNVFGFYIIIGLHGGCIGAFFFWKLFTFESDIFLIGV